MSNETAFLEKLVKEAYKKITTLEAELETARQPAPPEPIAVIGMGCRFPGADTPDAYWQLLVEGRSAVSDVLPERWDPERYAALEAATVSRDSWCHNGFLDQVDQFDPLFFRISPLEAMSMDPQQRLLLEVTWEALEHAAIAPDSLVESKTGVFVGMTAGQAMAGGGSIDSEQAMYAGTGNTPSIAAGRLSYVLGFQGPCFALDTACSSAMMATHVAVGSLRAGESDLALAGGVNVLTPEVNVMMANAGWLAADGRCKTFDAAADGHTRGEGCGIVVLKRLSDALRDGDSIWAVIRGSASNHDGRTSGLTVPNGPAQQTLIRAALQDAGIAPHAVSYSEAHATGTALGDGIEVGALGAVYAERELPLLISSVKPNLGHLEGASGASSLMKLVLAIHHGELPPHIGMQQPNPAIPWAELPVEVVTVRRPWPENSATKKRIGGVSGFGFSGTNIHMILEEPPAVDPAPSPAPSGHPPLGAGEARRGWHLLTLAAKDGTALQQLADRYATQLAAQPDMSLANLCYTANTGRNHFAHRLSVISESRAELQEKLAAGATGTQKMGLMTGQAPTVRPKIAFLFSGLGAQAVGMGRQLYEQAPVFRATIEQCDQLLRDQLAQPLTAVLYGGDTSTAEELLAQTVYAEPALFAVEYALAMLWRSWGIKPDVVLGHSLGEYVAATVAGVLSLEDALRLITARARLIERASGGGATASIFAGVDQVTELIAPFGNAVSIAGINSPEETLIAGYADAVEQVVAAAQAAGLDGKRLNVAHAAHSPLMDQVLAKFGAIAQQINYRTPRIKLISSLTGEVCHKFDAAHWQRHLREPVRFADSIAALTETDSTLMVEIGPQPILLWLGRQNWTGTEDAQWLPSLWAIHDDWKQLLQSLSELYVSGASVDWHGVYPREGHQKVVLPTYPFQRKRYWVDPPTTPIIPSQPSINGADHGGLNGHQVDELVGTQVPDRPTETIDLLTLEQLRAMTPLERPQHLLSFLQGQVAATLYLEAEEVQPNTNLVEYGMDSVMAMRILNVCRDALGFVLYPRDLYDRPVLQQFADYLATEYERLHGAGGSAVDASSASTSPALFATIAERTFTVPEQKNPPMLFVLSAPRSGSTLFRVMLAGHPTLFAPPELHLLWLERMSEFPHLDYLGEGLQRTLMALHGTDATASQAMIDRWVAEDRPIQEIYARLQTLVTPRWLIDKSPTYGEHLHVLQRIEQLFDQPKYIHLVRHPYAVIESYVRNRMDRIGGEMGRDAFAVAEQVWQRSNQNIQTMLTAVDPERQFTLRYEDLLRDPIKQMYQVADFLAISYTDALVQPYNGERMTDGVHAGSIPLGDMNFASHGALRPELADAWQTVQLPRALQTHTVELAQSLDYELPSVAATTRTHSLPSATVATSRPGAPHQVNGHNGNTGSVSTMRDNDPNTVEPNTVEPNNVNTASEPLVESNDVPNQSLAVFDTKLPSVTSGVSAEVDSTMRERTVNVQGLQLSVCEWGPLNGPTVVVVHGLLDHGGAWETVALELATAGYHVIAPDLRGHGHSEHIGAGGSYQLLDFVADIDGILYDLATRPVTLVGHSMGATVAAFYATARPQQVTGLILVEPQIAQSEQVPSLADQITTQLNYRTMQLQHPVFSDIDSAVAYLQEIMPAYGIAAAKRTAQRLTIPTAEGFTWRWDVALSTRSSLFTLREQIQEESGQNTYQTLLRQIPCPITIVVGTATLAHQRQAYTHLQQSLPSLEIVELPGTHHLHLDQAQAVGHAIVQNTSYIPSLPGAIK